MNIPYSIIEPFEPLGIPSLTNKRATLDELIHRLNNLMAERAKGDVYMIMSPDHPLYDHMSK